MNEITIGDKIYMSSKRAAEITGYAKDYISQLCREAKVDARMIGRSWYVYEDSIRAHRFGEGHSDFVRGGAIEAEEVNADPVMAQGSSVENTEESIPTLDDAAAPDSDTEESGEDVVNTVVVEGETPQNNDESPWNKAIYTSEEPGMMPEFAVSQTAEAQVHKVVERTEPETLTDMQEAWREWFDRKQLPEIESPEVIDAREEAYESEHEADRTENRAEQGSQDVAYNVVVNENTASKIEEEAIEDPEESVIDNESVDLHEEVNIPLHRIETAAPVAPRMLAERPEERIATQVPDTEAQVPITRAVASYGPWEESRGRILEERIVRRNVKGKGMAGKPKVKARGGQNRQPASNTLIIAMLVAISLISVSIAFVGSGISDRYITSLDNKNPIIKFLVGTRTYNNQ